jgi:NADH-quinone oxidoreductase subunit H
MPFWLSGGPILGFIGYLAKVLIIIATLSLLRTIFARLRIDQMVSFCWKYLAPLAFVQILFNLIVKGFVIR